MAFPDLSYKHLFTLELEVAADKSRNIGPVLDGRRVVVPVTGGNFHGERLSGQVLDGGADWVVFKPNGLMMIDVRLTLETEDSALIYLSYTGRFSGTSDAFEAMAGGGKLNPDTYSLVTTAKFECGAKQYTWLNSVVAVGKGQQSGFQPIYQLYEII